MTELELLQDIQGSLSTMKVFIGSIWVLVLFIMWKVS